MQAGLRGSHTVGPGAKVEDIELRKAMPHKWGDLMSIWRTATPCPQRGMDEAEVEETDPSKLNVHRWFIRKHTKPLNDNSLNALLKANHETHRTMTILHCRQSWEASETIIGYMPPPPPPLPRRGILTMDRL